MYFITSHNIIGAPSLVKGAVFPIYRQRSSKLIIVDNWDRDWQKRGGGSGWEILHMTAGETLSNYNNKFR